MSFFKKEIPLGVRVRDALSGFTGMTTSRVEYITGCKQYGIQPPVGEDGKMPDVIYLDEQRLEVLDPQPVEQASRTTGGPMRDAPSR